MPKRARYNNFTELFRVEQEYKDYIRQFILRNSNIAIIAPHGGSIEPGTSEIAAAIASDIFSLYAFEGMKPSGNFVLHIKSVYFDEPLCLRLIESVDTVVAVHGCREKNEAVYIGGLDQKLVQRASAHLANSGFHVIAGSKEYPGEHIQNICNRGRSGKGLQIEISEGLRKKMLIGLVRHERQTTTSILDQFVRAINEALSM